LKIELTEQEAASILEMADCALKTHGIRAMGAANMVVNKINAAKQAEANEKIAAVPDAQSVSPHPYKRKLATLLLLLSLSLHSLAQSYTFAWDPSPSHTNQIILYRLYASTNSLTYDKRMTAPIRLDAGTNTMAQVTNALNGTYWFYATAYGTNALESVFSDPLVVTVPVYAPQNLRTVFLQWNATVTGTNWIDTGFFRIKFGP